MPELSPRDAPAATSATTPVAAEGGDAYRRAEHGWVRTADGSAVVAADLTLGDLYDPPRTVVDGVDVRLVPFAWASRHPDHPLAWVFEHAELGSRAPIAVPEEEWERRSGEVVAMASPTLHPWNLVGIDGVAALLGVAEATVRAYLARGRLPAPLIRLGGTPVWSRDQIEAWHDTRPRAGSSRQPRRSPEPIAAAGDGVAAAEEGAR